MIVVCDIDFEIRNGRQYLKENANKKKVSQLP